MPTTANTMIFTANGTTYTDTGVVAAKSTSGGQTTIGVAGGNAAKETAGFTLYNESTAGTSYQVGPITLNGTTESYSTLVYAFNNAPTDSGSYGPPIGATSSVGNITIVSISATNIQATFNATLTRLTGNGPSTIQMTGGVNATLH